MTKYRSASLHVVGDRGQTVGGPVQDVRGPQVKGINRDGVGKLVGLGIDDHRYQSTSYAHYLRAPYWDKGGIYSCGPSTNPMSSPRREA